MIDLVYYDSVISLCFVVILWTIIMILRPAAQIRKPLRPDQTLLIAILLRQSIDPSFRVVH